MLEKKGLNFQPIYSQAERVSDLGDMAVGAHEMSVQATVASVLFRLYQEEKREEKIALARKDSGKEGICEDCGGPISEIRLKAKPKAVRCINCQEETELQRGPKGFRIGF